MVLVLVLDGIAYLLAVNSIGEGHHQLVAVLADIFVAVALLTISVGLVLPGMITYSATEVTKAAKRLTSGALRDFTRAMAALCRGDIQAAHASVDIVPVKANSRDELGEMPRASISCREMREAALSLDDAREKLHTARSELLARHEKIAHLVHHDPLTNLPNRTALDHKLARSVERAKRENTSFAVLSIGLDHSKKPMTFSATLLGMSFSAPYPAGWRAQHRAPLSRAWAVMSSR